MNRKFFVLMTLALLLPSALNVSVVNGQSRKDAYFPLWGITLGQTTWEQAQAMGYQVKTTSDGKDRHMDVGRVTFWDHDACGRFTSVYWLEYEADFPASWKAMGFNWENSYDQWLSTFYRLGYRVNVTKQPEQKIFSGRNTLSADVEVESADLKFSLDFDYGEKGYLTSSPRTLYSITIKVTENSSYNRGAANSSASSPSLPTNVPQSGNLLPGAVTGMELHSMLTKPMGTANSSSFTDSFVAIKNSLAALYQVDDSSEGNDYKIYIWASDNPSAKMMTYHGMVFGNHLINVDMTGGFLARRIKYDFDLMKTNATEPYSYMNRIVEDFKRLGIPMSYERKNEKYKRAAGQFRTGNIKYEISCNEYTSKWEISIDVWVYNN